MSNSKGKKKISAWLVLVIIAVIAAVLLAGTNELTKDTIAGQAEKAAEENRLRLVPGTAAFTAVEPVPEGLDNLYIGSDAEGKPTGYVGQITVTGFGGPVEIIAGMNQEGILNGISVGGSNFSETAGLGARSKEPAFTEQFAGLNATQTIGLNEGDNKVDALTAATITSKAVVRGVNTVAAAMAEQAGLAVEEASSAGALGNGRYCATVDGFGGPVYVEITLDESGTITDIVIGDDSFAETPGLGARAKEESFYGQFIGKSGTVDEIDAIAGATITSKAVQKAVNQAMNSYANPGSEIEAEPAPTPAADLEGAQTVIAKGFADGDIIIKVVLDGNTITALTIDASSQTPGLGQKASDEAFTAQFIGKTLPVEGIDAIASATITTNAVVDALNSLASAEVEDPFPAAAVDGEQTVIAKGFADGDIIIKVVLDGNTITALTIDASSQTPGLGQKASDEAFTAQFIGKTLPVEGIDAISSATITTNAVVDALNGLAVN